MSRHAPRSSAAVDVIRDAYRSCALFWKGHVKNQGTVRRPNQEPFRIKLLYCPVERIGPLPALRHATCTNLRSSSDKHNGTAGRRQPVVVRFVVRVHRQFIIRRKGLYYGYRPGKHVTTQPSTAKNAIRDNVRNALHWRPLVANSVPVAINQGLVAAQDSRSSLLLLFHGVALSRAVVDAGPARAGDAEGEHHYSGEQGGPRGHAVKPGGSA